MKTECMRCGLCSHFDTKILENKVPYGTAQIGTIIINKGVCRDRKGLLNGTTDEYTPCKPQQIFEFHPWIQQRITSSASNTSK